MTSIFSKATIRFLAGRCVENLQFDIEWLTSRLPLSVSERFLYIARKYFAIVGNRRQIKFLGHKFSYDNRLAPALLQTYPKEIEDIAQCVDLRALSTVFDVGANVGQFGWTLKSVCPSVHIFSFEPNPIIFPLLESNASRLSNWRVFNFGLGRQRKKIPFFFVPGKSAQGSAFKNNSAQNLQPQCIETLEIEVRELDRATLSEQSLPEQVDLLKVDVEGYELEALRGLSQIHWEHLFIEVSESREGGVTVAAVIELAEQIWKKTPRLVWEGTTSSTTRNVLFQMPK